jgi:hypothetical protein
MALPTLTDTQVEDIYVTTFNKKLPEVVDNVYNSNPFLALLNAGKQIKLDGGKQVEQGIIYDKLPSGFYGTGDTFNTQRVNTKTAFILDWKRAYVGITIDGMDDLQNAGAAAVFNHAQQKTQEAELTLKDTIGTGLMGNGNNDSGKAINGVEEWVDDGTNFVTIGGITRGTDAVGTAAKAIYDATGGSWTIPVLQAQYGRATIENEKPTLILTTQTLWDALSMRVQPQQRFPVEGSRNATLARIGFTTLQYQDASVVVDSHVPAGRAYGLNLKFWTLFVHTKRDGTKLRGWMPTPNKDERLTQLLWAGNVVCKSPRLCFQERGLTA